MHFQFFVSKFVSLDDECQYYSQVVDIITFTFSQDQLCN